MAWPLVCLKMGPSYANLFVTFFEHQFLSQYHGPKPELYGHYIDDCIGATSSTREDRAHSIYNCRQFISPALKYTWEICDTSLAFLDIKSYFEINSLRTSVNTTNLQIHTVTCCIHLRIHHTSRIPYLFHSFSDFVFYVVTTPVTLRAPPPMSFIA